MLSEAEILVAMKSAMSDEYSPPNMIDFARAVEQAAYAEAIEACMNLGKEIVCPEECAEAIRSLMQEQPK